METRTPSLVRGLGPIAATALVAGNVVGSGIYVIPASLAEVAGPVSLLAWGIVAAGFACLTVVFADLAAAHPVTGGLQVYVQRVFGDLAGLVTAFLYWVSCITANAAFVTAFVGYFQVLVPAASGTLPSFAVALTLLWSLTLVNVLGVRAGGAVQVVTTVLKILPLLVISVALFAAGSPAHLVPFAPHGYAALFPAISLVAWLFVGAESVTVPGEEIVDAGRTIPRAAYLGFGLATALYVGVALAIGLGLPAHVIAGTASPLAVAATQVLGPWGATLVTLGALISIGGILNGWLLVTGRVPFAAARQRLAPAVLGRLHPRFRTPALALVVSSTLSSLLVLLYFSRTLLQAYNLIALASTATALVAIGGACLAHLRGRLGRPAVPVAGLLIVILMIGGSGRTVLLLTLAVAVLPLPYFLWLRRRSAVVVSAP